MMHAHPRRREALSEHPGPELETILVPFSCVEKNEAGFAQPWRARGDLVNGVVREPASPDFRDDLDGVRVERERAAEHRAAGLGGVDRGERGDLEGVELGLRAR